MEFSKIKYLLPIPIVVLMGILLIPSQTKAEGVYNRGLQHLYPYYLPESENQVTGLSENYYLPLRGENDAQKVKNFALEQIELNEIGSVVFGSALYNASQLDPGFNQDNLCGIAGWECNSERWQRFLNFSEIHSLNHQDLKSQLIFVNFEFNGLSAVTGSQGPYQTVFNNLRITDDFILSSSLFMQNYFNKTPENLTGVARTLYDYELEREYNEAEPEPEIPPEPEPEIPPEPEPEIPPEPEPEIIISPPEQPTTQDPPDNPIPPDNPLPSQPTINASDCQEGLSGGYIAIATAGDQKGRFLETLSVVDPYNANQFTVTLAHRCLKDSLRNMLSKYNSQAAFQNRGGGWVWRSNAKQIEFRTKHCGTSYYDIWEKLANDCDPPTARPGYSSHQDGLAIDFYCSTGTLTRINCGGFFEWLDCNAAEYGLINLPEEAWHWYYPLKQPHKLVAKLKDGC